MRFIVCCTFFLALIVAFAYASPVPEDLEDETNQAVALLDVDGQGHENESERLARQYGYYGGGFRRGYGFGGYRGYGGYGGYGGYRRGYGGYGGYRRGWGGYGGYGFYG